MEKWAYLKIEEELTPRDASILLETAKKNGFEKIILLHQDKADRKKSAYKEKLLSVFRAAYRHKVEIYLADDSFMPSGTAFGELCSVRDLWQKKLRLVKKAPDESGESLAEKDGEFIIAEAFEKNDSFPYGHMPDLTNPQCAQLVTESIYKDFIKEYKKFAGYEFKGFVCIKPYFDKDALVYSESVVKENPKIDLFEVVKGGKAREEYIALTEKAVAENYLKPLKAFAEENNMDFIICSGEGSVENDLCEKYSRLSLSDSIKGKYYMFCDDSQKAVMSGLEKIQAVVPVGPFMGELAQINKSLCELDENYTIKSPWELEHNDTECVLINPTEEKVSLCFIGEDMCIENKEKGEVYPLEKALYTFYPYSFLKIGKMKGDMYQDKAPCKITGVEIGEWKEECRVEFEKVGDVFAFYLPEDALSGKAIRFHTDARALHVRLGSMEEKMVQEPFIMPLFDFLRGARGGVISDGELKKITIEIK